jgi:hypothetical protein
MESSAPPAATAAAAHTTADLAAALRNPLRLLDLALADRARLLATVAEPRRVAQLATVLLVGGAVFALPFGCVLGAGTFWQVACLFEGSLLLCYPSLHVFAVYFGLPLSIGQSLALVSWATCTASLFTFGFAPIQWFLERTMQTGDLVRAGQVGVVLLILSLVAGLATIVGATWRNLRAQRTVALPLLTVWLVLFVFITGHMARVLGIT